MKNQRAYTIREIQVIHLVRAKEFDELSKKCGLSDTERNTLERLRDQRVQLAEDLN